MHAPQAVQKGREEGRGGADLRPVNAAWCSAASEGTSRIPHAETNGTEQRERGRENRVLTGSEVKTAACDSQKLMLLLGEMDSVCVCACACPGHTIYKTY